MWMMLQQEDPDDYVIATGETSTVREFVELAISAAGLNGKLEDFVDFDENMLRPSEVELLVGDASKALNRLGWAPKTRLPELVKLMVENDLNLENMRRNL
jgi:GDPmannose 4,6-dehydratase